MSFAKEVWSTLSAVDCSQHVQVKMKLSYLSWAWAWATLMKHYPESTYTFDESVTTPEGTSEIWVTLAVVDGDKRLERRMWLPVMDHKNNAIIKPTTRHISDTRMRCLTKCLAMFGLGHYIYAGEDLPDPEAVQGAIEVAYEKLVDDNTDSIQAIKDGIQQKEYSSAAEAWFELNKEVKEGIWKAPSRGGCFSTQEREVIKSTEFREAHYGATV